MQRLTVMMCGAALLVACGAADPNSVDSGTGTDGADPQVDAPLNAPDAPPGCANMPAPDPSWITGYVDAVVAGLTSLSDRASSGRRTTARNYLVDELNALGLSAQIHNYGTGGNPYAVLPSTTGSTSTFVLGAHFDSVPGSPGANDNATGVALVLAVARYLTSVDCRQSNVYFVLFDEEEIGLVGSYAFAQFLANQNVDVVSVHTVDQMGWDNDGDRAVELERPSGNLYSEWAQSKSAAGLTMTLHQTDTGSTDHVSFRQFGFPAVGLTEEYVNGDTSPHYHSSGDTYATVDFAYLRSTTVLANAHFARLVRLSSAQLVRSFPTKRWPDTGRGHALHGCRAAYPGR